MLMMMMMLLLLLLMLLRLLLRLLLIMMRNVGVRCKRARIFIRRSAAITLVCAAMMMRNAARRGSAFATRDGAEKWKKLANCE